MSTSGRQRATDHQVLTEMPAMASPKAQMPRCSTGTSESKISCNHGSSRRIHLINAFFTGQDRPRNCSNRTWYSNPSMTAAAMFSSPKNMLQR